MDAGGGWLIFKLPVAEAALHPGEGGDRILQSALYLMCDDLAAEMAILKAKNVSCGAVTEERWGWATTFSLPSGGQLGLYQPLHPTALGL